MKRLLCLLSLLLWLVAGVSTLHAEVTATATLNVQSFPLSRAAQLSISVQGTRSFQPQIPEVEGLRLHQQGQSTQVQIINGDYSVSVTSTYLVEALRSGSFVIPAIKIEFKDGVVETAAIPFTVTKVKKTAQTQPAQKGSAAATRLGSGAADEVAFMRVVPEKQASYSGEVVPVQIKVYFRDGLQAELNSVPQLTGEGFVLEQLTGEPARTREIVGNSRYAVLIWDSALTGIKEGEHTLSMELDATLLLRQQRRDPFGRNSFFGDFFSSYREKEVKVTSPKLEMKVLSLPEDGKPANFSGAIGDFHLQVNAEPLVIAKGDPVTLIMTVSGEGNFDRVQVPELQEKEGWKRYTPSSVFHPEGRNNLGKKVFEQALVAKSDDVKHVPSLAFSYFDPQVQRYKNLVSAPIPLNIQSVQAAYDDAKDTSLHAGMVDEEEIGVVQTNKTETKQLLPGLAPLQLDSGKMNTKLEPLFVNRWFLLFCAMVLFLIAIVMIVRFRQAKLAGNPRLQRQRSMQQLQSQREIEMSERLTAGDSHGFLRSCRTLIQEQLGLLWDMEAAAITQSDLQGRLTPDSVLVAIFRAAEDSAYGGQELSEEQMQEFSAGLKKELEALL